MCACVFIDKSSRALDHELFELGKNVKIHVCTRLFYFICESPPSSSLPCFCKPTKHFNTKYCLYVSFAIFYFCYCCCRRGCSRFVRLSGRVYLCALLFVCWLWLLFIKCMFIVIVVGTGVLLLLPPPPPSPPPFKCNALTHTHTHNVVWGDSKTESHWNWLLFVWAIPFRLIRMNLRD